LFGLDLEISNSLYSIGNLSRGKLSQPNYYSRSRSTTTPEVEEDDEPVMKILPRATLVDTESVIEQESGKIVQIETGYEHLLVLTGKRRFVLLFFLFYNIR